eukprot:12398970-Karenia_brevis.AAC.1
MGGREFHGGERTDMITIHDHYHHQGSERIDICRGRELTCSSSILTVIIMRGRGFNGGARTDMIIIRHHYHHHGRERSDTAEKRQHGVGET